MSKARTVALLTAGALAMAALALPSLASASEWTFEGEPLQEEAAVQVEGTYGYSSFYGSFKCGIEGEATLLPGDEGEIAELVTTSEPCEGHFADCEVRPQFETPWPIEARTKDILVTEATEKWLLSGCFFSEIVMEGSMQLTPGNPSGITSLSLYGVMFDSITSIPLIVTGELEVTPAGTYGFQ
jgi:hypothetical protein